MLLAAKCGMGADNSEVIPTMKVKRKAIAEQYKDIIEEINKACSLYDL